VSFLPIVDRELRVAARKRSTFWVRVAAALVALVIGGGFLVLELVNAGFAPTSLGRSLFAALTWLALAAVLSAGLFFTSDCLSEEKREGTLGFLFLTDLRGHDVVLGKLLATSLRGFYALLAVFPILGVTLLLGGVTGGQFWKTSLALVNALWLSLAAGLFVSAVSRDAQKALAATLLLLLVLTAGGPVCDGIIASSTKRPFDPVLSLASPGYVFVTAGTWGRTPYWTALLVNQLLGWALLGLACGLVPRTWQEKAGAQSTCAAGWAYWWQFGGDRRRAVLRRKLLEVNPVLWLACRERWQAATLWAVTLLAVGGVAALLVFEEETGAWIAWNYLGGFLTLLLYLGIASQAGRLLVDGRRSGLLELLLSTPLTAPQIVRGQWRALLRLFGLPVALCLALQFVGSFMAQQAWSGLAAAAPPPPPPPATGATATGATNVAVPNVVIVTSVKGSGGVTVSATGLFTNEPGQLMALATAAAGTLAVAANLVALVWFGLWMGLNSKHSSLATLKTILFVQIIPWFAISFASMLVVPLLLLPNLIGGAAAGPWPIMAWFPLLSAAMTTVLYLIKAAAFSLWSRHKLYTQFQERAARADVPVRMTLPPRLPPVVSTPWPKPVN
jgi:ABC-type transport system involved in multi-copper enzyme maturation permease subunit